MVMVPIPHLVIYPLPLAKIFPHCAVLTAEPCPLLAIENGCISSTFAEDDKRVIVYTRWSDEMALEQFRSSKEYHNQEGKIIQSFAAAGFEIPDDILFNSTAKILFSN